MPSSTQQRMGSGEVVGGKCRFERLGAPIESVPQLRSRFVPERNGLHVVVGRCGAGVRGVGLHAMCDAGDEKACEGLERQEENKKSGGKPAAAPAKKH